MKRREFLTLTGIGAGMVIVPPSLYFVAPEVKNYAHRLLVKELFYLKLEPTGISAYIDDYFNATGNDMVARIKWKVSYYMGLNWENSERISDLIKYYLLSSDFFINLTDERKTVHYLGLFNSYKSPVPNPYSFVLYPPSTIKDI